jgi:hypothetical protein
VVRWRACDLIMRLYEEFGLSVSDDTIYRALKTLGFSHVIVSVAGNPCDLSKRIFCDDVSEFESHMPSHAVVSIG